MNQESRKTPMFNQRKPRNIPKLEEFIDGFQYVQVINGKREKRTFYGGDMLLVHLKIIEINLKNNKIFCE
jgi:hypothetical protein